MQRSWVFFLFCLFFCIPAFPQNSGTVLCDSSSMTAIPAWIAPGWPYVVDQLPCGQTVKVLGRGTFPGVSGYSSRPIEYAKIQIDERVAYVDAKYIGKSEAAPPPPKKIQDVARKTQRNKTDEAQNKWGIVSKDQVKMRDEVLLKPVYLNGPRTFTATLSNSSNLPVSQLLLLVRLYDCSDKPKDDFSNCEIIGEAKPVISAPIPPGQTRRVRGFPLFEATPPVRGSFAWGYQILNIRVE